MSSNVVSSKDISVFPCGNRCSDYDLQSRITTEYNLISIINKLVDKDSFCIDDTFNKGNATDFVFNIHGYLFSVPQNAIWSSVGSSATNIYATIGVRKTQNDMYELAPIGLSSSGKITIVGSGDTWSLDDSSSGNFNGVLFTTTIPTIESPTSGDLTPYTLKIVETQGSKQVVPQDSLIKFETTNDGKRSLRIDDGLIE